MGAVLIITIIVVLFGLYLIFGAKHNIESKNKNNPMDNNPKTTRLD
jgi:hypothetical protein